MTNYNVSYSIELYVVICVRRLPRKMCTCYISGYGIISVVFTLKVYIISYIVTADGKEYAHVSLH